MLTQETTSIGAPQEPKQALLPTYPQEDAATLTPRQRRANNAGQRYYTSRFAGTITTQAQLDAAMEHKQRQWQRNDASLEWQIHFTKGWNAAILNDPTISRDGEKDQQPRCIPEDPTTGSLILGGEDDDENNRVPHQTDALVLSTADGPTNGEADTPIFGKDDDEDRRPVLGDDSERDDEWGRHRPGVTFGPYCDDEHPFDEGWSPIKCGEPTTPIYGDSDAPVFGPEGNDGGWGSPIFHIWQRLVYGPEGGDRPGWSKAQLPILARGDSDAPVFGPEAGGRPGWMIFGKPPMMPTEPPDGDGDDLWISFGPKDDGGPGFLPLFGPDGGTEPGWAALLCAIIYAPEGGDGTGWSPILCIPVIFIGIVTQCPRLDPEDTDDEVGSYHQIKQGEPYAPPLGWHHLTKQREPDAPLFGPEDGDETGWHHPIRRDVVAALGSKVSRDPSLIDDDDEDYRLKFAPHEGDDETWGSMKFGPTGGDDETWRHFAHLTFGPQGDDETWDRATTTLGDRALSQPEALRILHACLPVAFPSFGPRDDEDEGFLRPRTEPSFRPENDDEPGEYRPSWGDEREADGHCNPRSRKIIALYPSFDEEKGADGEDYRPRCGGESDLDGEGFRPLFGDDDDQEEEKGGWHHRRFTAFGLLQRERIAC